LSNPKAGFSHLLWAPAERQWIGTYKDDNRELWSAEH